jgi:RNA polymerase sigma factor (sigma-70 family)
MNWRRDIDQWFVDEVLPHGAAFRSYARRLSLNDEEADDLVQEAYANTLSVENWRAIDGPRSFVFRVIHNLAVSRIRRDKVVTFETVPDMAALGTADPAPDAFAQAAARQELARLENAIRALPDKCRQVVTLRKIYELPPDEIAGRLKISVSTVEKHLSKGMRLVAEALNDAPTLEASSKRFSWARTNTRGDKQ